LIRPLLATSDHGHFVDPGLRSRREAAEDHPGLLEIPAKRKTPFQRQCMEHRQIAGDVRPNAGLDAEFEEAVVDRDRIAVQADIGGD
jgi:hypothetical protein